MFQITMIDVFGSLIPVLSYTGDIPDFMPVKLAQRLDVKPSSTIRRTTVDDYNEAVVVGEVQGVPATVWSETTELTCLVVRKIHSP